MNKLIDTKILKGTRDFLPAEMAKRNYVMQKLRTIFERFGYDTIETPVIAYAETILGKYGDEGDRLTYTFEDNGGRRIALPYDLTVPFARLFAANFRDLAVPFKRYQIQRVWRAEKPQQGRLREFYQCDIDTIGTTSLLAEAEITRVIYEVFKALGFSRFTIQINSRRLMNAIFESLGLGAQNLDLIRVIDKKDKIGAEGVKKELASLGVDKDAIALLINLLSAEKTNMETVEKLQQYDTSEIAEFLRLAGEFSIPDGTVKFNPALARGLDYYTGIVYEVMSEDFPFGSLCGGGRYDNLCGLFCKEAFSGVGVSFGFERLMIALEQMGKLQDVSLSSRALITFFPAMDSADLLKIYTVLLNDGVNSEIYFQQDKLEKQFKYADKKNIPFVIMYGPEEKERGEVTIKSMRTGKQKKIPFAQLTSYLRGI